MSPLLILLILPALCHAADTPPPLEISAAFSDGSGLRLLVFQGVVERVVEHDKVSVLIFHQISDYSAPVKLRLRSTNNGVIAIDGPTNFTLTADGGRSWPSVKTSNLSEWETFRNSSAAINVTLVGMFLGRASIVFEVENKTAGDWTPMSSALKVSVIRSLFWRKLDKIFTVIAGCLIVFANLGMGTKLELKVVKEVLRRPLAPFIGFMCQYTIMPLVAFGVGSLLKLPPRIFLGYFAIGCGPGGVGSNKFAFLLGGDLSLSITMTLISTTAALGNFPLWLFTLGQHILNDDEHALEIPFKNIFLTLSAILVPVVIGYLIRLKLPKVTNVINIVLKPFIVICSLVFFGLGIFAKSFIFRLFTPAVILAGCLLPYCGFIMAGLVATIARLKKSFVITVAIETGLQNTAVPILLMKLSLPEPDSDLTLVGPITVWFCSTLPLLIAVLGSIIYNRCFKKDGAQSVAEEEKVEGENEEEKEEKIMSV